MDIPHAYMHGISLSIHFVYGTNPSCHSNHWTSAYHHLSRMQFGRPFAICWWQSHDLPETCCWAGWAVFSKRCLQALPSCPCPGCGGVPFGWHLPVGQDVVPCHHLPCESHRTTVLLVERLHSIPSGNFTEENTEKHPLLHREKSSINGPCSITLSNYWRDTGG